MSPLRKHGPPKDDFTPRKKLKTSDLPLSHAKRAAIEELVLTIKKKGDFDSLRKIVWTSYDRSVSLVFIHGYFHHVNVC